MCLLVRNCITQSFLGISNDQHYQIETMFSLGVASAWHLYLPLTAFFLTSSSAAASLSLGSYAVSGGSLCTYIGHNYVQMGMSPLRHTSHVTSHVIDVESVGERHLLSNALSKHGRYLDTTHVSLAFHAYYTYLSYKFNFQLARHETTTTKILLHQQSNKTSTHRHT